MPSPATSRTAEIEASKAAVEAIEVRLWADGFDESLLGDYQRAFRDLEAAIAAEGDDRRHKIVVVIPVADRPRLLAACLDSLLDLCRAYGYGGLVDGRYRKVAAMIADDSADAAEVAANRELAARTTAKGLETLHFGPEEQIDLLAALGEAGGAALARIVGPAPDSSKGPGQSFGHKGQGAMRNIASLRLAQWRSDDGPLLFHSVDSDQEFKVKVATAGGDKDVLAINFFHRLDEIFSRRDVLVLTGKVVGDPPVSPAVMAGNFVEDVIGFLAGMAEADPGTGPCRHHEDTQRREGEAAYHDMADLFGFRAGGEAYRYRCPLAGAHADSDCLDHFSRRLHRFFHGEHPTRVSYYQYQGALDSVAPARTVYAGNYVFRPEALDRFIPFGPLRLRMSGPTLGRLLKADLGPRFVSANLPMLHKRTSEETGDSEFRPGVEDGGGVVDLADEFERQFQGDVMLFSVERLTGQGYPDLADLPGAVEATLGQVRAEMLEKYRAQRRALQARLARLDALLDDPARWWNRSPHHAPAMARFRSFAANLARNFGEDSGGAARIESAERQAAWHGRLKEALLRYPEDRQAWARALERLAP